jgi:NADPH:quinone reductase-like Zn-dependent oxidoreductase
MDISQREGNYPVPPQAGPILGVEFAGVIEKTCGHCLDLYGLALTVASGFKEGDEVFGLAYGGAYAEYIAVDVKMIVHKPMELSWETAAGLPEVWFTAIQACFLVGNLSAGQTVLFHAGASCIYPLNVQWG